jgi:pantoate--beta-alanine ligase
MKIIKNINQWQIERHSLTKNETIGFVPTMGNLHRGHLSLIEHAKVQNKISAVSIYVNPTQFNNKEDFVNYPNTKEKDFALLNDLGVDYVLTPSYQELYKDNYQVQINETYLSKIMEGTHRPGHFTGMLTVVMKLLNIVKASCAYFGEKDYQQFLLVKKMAQAFFIDTQIIACPTIREASILAYSSRNSRLTKHQKKQAVTFAQIFHKTNNCKEIISALSQENIKIDYVNEFEGRRYAAVFIDDIRLIDNYEINKA